VALDNVEALAYKTCSVVRKATCFRLVLWFGETVTSMTLVSYNKATEFL